MSNQLSKNNAKDEVHEWLMNDGWSLRKESYPEVAWAFVAQDQYGRKIVVGQKVDRQDELLIQAAVTIDDDIRSKIEQLDENDRNEFIWNLRFELLRTELDFKGVEISPKTIEVMTRITTDALKKDAFRRGIQLVGKGILIVQWMLMRKFAQQPPKQHMGLQR